MSVSLITNTELAASIDEKWDMDVLEALYANATIMPRIANKSDIVKNSGDIVNVTIDANLTVQTVGSDGSFNITQVTPSSVALTVDQWKLVQLGTTNRAEAQSFWDIKSTFPKSAGKALAADYDAAIAALYSGLTLTQIGSEPNPVTFGKVPATSALLRLAQANVPLTNLTFVLPPEAVFSGILQETDFTDASSIGGSSKSPLIDGRWSQNILGVPIAMSTQLSLANQSTLKGMLIHKNAFAIAMQKNNDFERFSMAAGGYAGKAVKMESLYGVKTIRGNHGCVINIAKN